MHKAIIYSLLIGFMVVACGPALAEGCNDITRAEAKLDKDPDNLELLLEVGGHYLTLNREGDKDAGKKADKYLKKAVKLAPADCRALTLHGSVLILKGRDAMLPMNKMRHVNNGLELFDRAVTIQPNDFETRFQRANYCANLPGIFNRMGTAVGDFRHLLTMSIHSPDAVEPGYVTYIKLTLARLLDVQNETAEATALLQELIDTPPTEDAPARAEKLLAGMKG